MKNLIYILLFVSIKSSAQDISGLYSGTLTNDSLKMIQNYELALSEYKGKITGFSYITFVMNDTFYYGIKRVEATRENGELVVRDVKMLMNNYPQRADKGVHLINKIPLSQLDGVKEVNGRWETTKTKKFYSISGDMSLKKDDDSTHSSLIAHLKELDIVNYQDEKKDNKKDIAKTEQKQKPKEIKTELQTVAVKENKTKEIPLKEPSQKEKLTSVATNETTANTTEQKRPEPKETKPVTVVEIKSKENESESISKQVTTTDRKITENKSNTQSSNPEPKTQNIESSKNIIAVSETEKNSPKEPTSKEVKQTAVKETQAGEIKATAAANNIAETKSQVKTTEPEKVIVVPSVIEKRVNNTIQTVSVASDSLVLSFYDNGVVDGDSISVYVNGENVISKVKLKEAAVKKTIYLGNENAETKLTLVAENLGSIPPNTGLLIIQDGTDRYQIRFSADMETNASVIIKKKKK
jgi:hypothetical protein